MAKDLVCGMEVDPAEATAKSEYNGQTYYFCAPGCKTVFEANPAQYVKEQAQGGHHGEHDSHHGGHGGHH